LVFFLEVSFFIVEDTFSRNQVAGDNTSCELGTKRRSLDTQRVAARPSTSDDLMDPAILTVQFETAGMQQVLLAC
jgi:hypothetical protein